MIYNDDITDAHMHLWDLANDYPWLKEPSANFEKMIGDYAKFRQNFFVKDYQEMSQGCRVTKTVNVEALGFPDNPVNETRWLQQQADQYGLSNAIVARVKLDLLQVEESLAANCEYKNMRGVRMILNWHDTPYLRMADRPDYMQDDQWLYGFSLLEKYNLSFDFILSFSTSSSDNFGAPIHLAFQSDLFSNPIDQYDCSLHSDGNSSLSHTMTFQ